MKFSLKYKLLISFMAVVIVVLAGVTVGGSVLIRDYFVDAKRRELTDKAYEMARVVNNYFDGRITYSQLHDFVNSADSFLDARIWVVDNDLNLVTVSEERPGEGYGKRRSAAGIKPSPMRLRENSRMGPPWWQSRQPGQQQGSYGMGMRGRMAAPGNSQAQTVEPPASQPPAPIDANLQTGENAGNPIVLDVGKGRQQNSAAAAISLADIKGMAEIIEEIKANSGKTWAKTYYHPYYEENMLMVAVPLKRTDGTISGTVMVNAPLDDINEFLQKIYYYIGIAGLAAILLAALLSSYLAGGIVRPLRAMQQTAAAMARGDYTTRIRVTSRDEVGDLGQSLNALAQDMEEYVRRLEQLDKMRRDFVANVSHELRTPLTIMHGYNQALQDGTITDPALVKKYHRVMGEEIMRLEKLIADLLDLSQLQANGLTLDIEEVSLAEIVDNVVTLLKPRSEEKGVSLAACVAPGVPPIQGDGDRLTQLALILVDNALKFTPPGGRISIDLTVQDGEEVLTVADTGTGIAPEDLPYIWERFYKGDKSRASSGTGLGLAIARQIIELHGAKVDVTSRCGEGTVFTIRFPLEKKY
ncbi:integral membrane sensor signal transduction histidine kinase [Thermosinus carboxydivorans Nor1]|uniref:histidine kinase n=1 Tax=Thermosinus carboxydivorans Nor1 TaxID=401526 RepID=A1HUB4_9FIRM|nr:HAMP domain-containing sensor histidine kinase [Thermosinus carboxydivorans]EAX46393.1 integral membrane sensor signal transduction histidine kinase [Thermosinus carboxydivorans Nor1]